MFELFMKGGPVMWPLLLVSIATVSTVVERLWFIWQERKNRKPADIEAFFAKVEKSKLAEALEDGSKSPDFVVRALSYGLGNRDRSLSNALLQAANRELARFGRGLAILDTTITLAPFLGLLGTVVGLIHSFGLLGDQELAAPTALTGGIAEALIATSFGLSIAIVALIPFNYLNARLEQARHELEDNATQLELILKGKA